MNVQVTGKNMNLGEALRSRIVSELESGIDKYFERGAQDANVFVTPDGSGYRVDCTVNLASGRTVISHGHGGDAHAAFDDALTKIEKRVRRYKRKLRNHHVPGGKASNPGPDETAPLIVLQTPSYEDDDGDDLATREDFEGIVDSEPQPMIIAETVTSLPTLTVSMAVLELDLRGYPVLMFRNAGHGGISLVYRRPDGNIGWIDPERTRNGESRAA
jgi:ribosomal subunit interface protein